MYSPLYLHVFGVSCCSDWTNQGKENSFFSFFWLGKFSNFFSCGISRDSRMHVLNSFSVLPTTISVCAKKIQYVLQPLNPDFVLWIYMYINSNSPYEIRQLFDFEGGKRHILPWYIWLKNWWCIVKDHSFYYYCYTCVFIIIIITVIIITVLLILVAKLS